MTRTKALEIYSMSADDFDKCDIDDIKSTIESRFRSLVKQVHPDTANGHNKNMLSISDIKKARDVLIEFAAYKNTNTNDSGDVCPYCLGEGYIKTVKGFEIVSEICKCVNIKKK